MEAERPRSRRPSATAIVLVACALAALFVVALPRKRSRLEAPFPSQLEPSAGVSAFDPALIAAFEAALSPPATDPAPTIDELAQRVAALGSPALPVVVAVLCGEIDTSGGDLAGFEVLEVHPRAIELRDAALRAALSRFNGRRVVAEIAERNAPASSVDARIAAARLLGELEEPSALAALLRIIDGIEPIQLMRSYVQLALESALSAQLARQPDAYARLELDARLRDPRVLAVHARATGRVPSAAGARYLTRLAGRDPELDVVVAIELGRIGEAGRIAPPEDALDAVRSMLDDSEPSVRRASAVAAGKLRDEGAFALLAEILASEDPLVSSAARPALKSIAGQDLGADALAWLDWRDREYAWAEELAPRALEQLDSGDPGAVAEAIVELTSHPLFRHEAADALGPLAGHEDLAIAHTACQALIALRSSHALPWLVAALEYADDDRAEVLRSTLSDLTGLGLSADVEAWRRALDD